MFGLKIVKESELTELRMHKRLSSELLDPLKDIWPFIRDVRATCERRPEYLEGIKRGVVHIAFHPGCKPQSGAGKILADLERQVKERREPITGQTICGQSHTARMEGGEL